MNWIDALKVFNEGKPSWCIPRKDTADYEAVKAIREKREEKPKPKPKKDKKEAKARKEIKALLEKVLSGEEGEIITGYGSVGFTTKEQREVFVLGTKTERTATSKVEFEMMSKTKPGHLAARVTLSTNNYGYPRVFLQVFEGTLSDDPDEIAALILKVIEA